ncbi:hypothetical protein ACHQM5_021605 [Ranunculus cassubicifolius]
MVELLMGLLQSRGPNIVSYINASHSEHEDYKHEEMPPSVMGKDLLQQEELQKKTLARTYIPMASRRAIETIPLPVKYSRLEPYAVQTQPE